MRSGTLLLTIAMVLCCTVQAKPKGITVLDIKHLALPAMPGGELQSPNA